MNLYLKMMQKTSKKSKNVYRQKVQLHNTRFKKWTGTISSTLSSCMLRSKLSSRRTPMNFWNLNCLLTIWNNIVKRWSKKCFSKRNSVNFKVCLTIHSHFTICSLSIAMACICVMWARCLLVAASACSPCSNSTPQSGTTWRRKYPGRGKVSTKAVKKNKTCLFGVQLATENSKKSVKEFNTWEVRIKSCFCSLYLVFNRHGTIISPV